MALSAEQRAIIGRRLPLHHVAGDVDQPIQLTLTGRELRFLLEAIASYRDERCAQDELQPECELVYWYEGAQGHIDRTCEHYCEQLIDKLLTQVPERR